MPNLNPSQTLPSSFVNPTHVTFKRPSYGVSPTGFRRIHVELIPREVGRLIGYDPRTLVVKRRRSAAGTKPPVDKTPHNVAPQIVNLQNEVQRSIDNARVRAMVDYLRAAMDSGSFADWGAIELVTSARPDMSRFDTHHEILMDADADYFIADGQHRYCAILDFCRAHPDYCDRFTQPITISVLPEDKLAVWAGQAFHDRNYFAVAVRAGKALSVDSRDPINALAKELASHPVIAEAGGIAYERDTLLKNDTRFTTHSVIHRFVKGFLFGRAGLERGAGDAADLAPEDMPALVEYISALGEVMPWFGEPEERDQLLSRASVVLSALAVVGHDLRRAGVTGEALTARLATLGRMDWRRTNLSWVGVVGTERDGLVYPASSRPVIDATIRYFRERLGLLKSPLA